MGDDSTIVIANINSALKSSDDEAAEKPAALLVVGGDLNGALFDLNPPDVTVGRNSNNFISLDFQGISRFHFKLVITETSVVIYDSGSKNGTYLNNKRLTIPTELTKGDIIKIGNIALKFLPRGDPERLTYDKLKYDANIDRHTKCYNKTYFNNANDLEVKKCKVTGNPLSLLFFDIDHFKKLNDTYGHDAGDYVLAELAELIRASGIRSRDIFARYGGEEFIILLPETPLKHAFEIAERLRKTVEQHPFNYDNTKLAVRVSIGIADYRQGVLNGTDLLKRADKALYMAKNNGRNQVQFYRG